MRFKYLLVILLFALSGELPAQDILLQQGHSVKSFHMEVHPNGRYVATSSGELRIWDIYSRKLLRAISPGGAGTSIMRFNNDAESNFLLTTERESAYVYLIDISKGKSVQRWFLGEDFLPSSVEWINDSDGSPTRFYVLGYKEIREYDIQMEDYVKSISIDQSMIDGDQDVSADEWGVRGLDAFMKGGRLSVIPEINSLLLRFHDTLLVAPFNDASRRELLKLELGSHLFSWDYCASQNTLAVGTNDDFRLFDLNTGEMLWQKPNKWIDWEHQIKISHNGDLLFLDYSDSADVINWRTGRNLLHLTPTVQLAEFTHDDQFLIVGGWNEPFVFSLQTRKVQTMDVFENELLDLEFIDDMTLLMKDHPNKPSDSVFFDLRKMEFLEGRMPVAQDIQASFDPNSKRVKITGPTKGATSLVLDFKVNDLHISELSAKNNMVSDVAVSADGTSLFVIRYVVDPTFSKSTRKRYKKQGYFSYNPDKARQQVVKYDVSNKKSYRLDTESPKIKSFHDLTATLIRNDSFLLVEGGDLVYIYRTADMKLVADLSPPQPKNWFTPVESCAYVAEKNLILINQSGELHVHSANSFELLGSLYLPFKFLVNQRLVNDNTLLIAGNDGKADLVTLDLETVKLKNSWKVTDGPIYKILLMEEHLIVLDQDGKIDFLEFPSLEFKASMITDPHNKQFVLYDSTGVYYGTKDILQYVTLTEGLENYTISQFDAKFNRPHEILSKFSFVDQDKVELMKRIYEKRHEQGQDLSMLDISRSPSIAVDPIAFESKSKYVDIELKAQAVNNDLRSIKVLVNDVPIYGLSGLRLQPTGTLDTSLTIRLIEGQNDIQISVLDGSGAESAIERRMVRCLAEDGKDSLILITIAVSHFENGEYDLKYAVKDGRDLQKCFKNSNEEYINRGFSSYVQQKTALRMDSLFNDEVNRENFNELRDRLSKLRPQDKVVLSMSGHGLLDADLKWWFATHDMDFDDPAARGISYEMIMDVLSSCPSRHKILLLDACHSGELDRSVTYETTESEDLRDGVVRLGTRGARARKSSAVGLENSYDLMKEYFLDMNAGTGVYVIAAASGDSYALESDKWGNGVFTSSVIHSLEEAPLSAGPSVSELKDQVGQRVAELTKGKQQPMTRSGSPKYDFRIFD